ncbi:hypothetical protein [Bergeriella denitrificans]|uniref:Uncharacterized protein conserved in bacteria n=1 Tax=Bergeriella denitrificans TaxID=494 RepID=A0A378UHI8_BERDE|nr:hypothetical protein [Bergeriella denitrificans]STZ76848.1 Uncharacterized protein conserved in bacteria [Bergeriella denitrificans]
MTRQDELHKDTEQWENRELGASEAHVRRADVNLNALDEALGLKPISIRLQQGMIDDLKAIAAFHGIGYQPLIKQVLARFIEGEQKKLANELIREALKQREKKDAA